MKKTVYVWISAFLFSSIISHSQDLRFVDQGKQRVIVLTDITNEPDDQQSLVRFLVYANEYDVEGLVATTSVHLRRQVRPEKIGELLDAYEKVKPNLDRHAKDFPSAAYLRSVTTSHLPLYGMQGVGEGKDSPGSELIIRAADKKDDRPVWISVWGGANCLAQALWKVQQTRSPGEVQRFISKLKIYSISDQDDSGRWIRTNFPGIFYVVSPSAESWLEYYRATWTGISGDRHYKNGPMYKFEMVDNPWLLENIITNHGPLGALYPKLEYIMEGDTPAFIGLINNGLGSAISPSYGGWSGRYELFQSYAEAGKIWTNNINTVDEVVLDDGRRYASDQATIWRWRDAYQADFAARMDWCIASAFSAANHNPLAAINGNLSKDVVMLKAAAGQTITLSAKGSKDPDGNALAFRWFHYREAGNNPVEVPLQGAASSDCTLIVPPMKEGQSLHLVCEVRDDGLPSLVSYRRVVITR
jgi:hypothetical protein